MEGRRGGLGGCDRSIFLQPRRRLAASPGGATVGKCATNEARSVRRVPAAAAAAVGDARARLTDGGRLVMIFR